MNVVALVGNVASDPKLTETPGGTPVCEFRLAVSRPGPTDAADFFTVVAWERQAKVCNDYLCVGRRVAIDGRMRHSVWSTEEGRRSKVEVVAHRVHLLGGRRPAPTNDAPNDAATASAETSSSEQERGDDAFDRAAVPSPFDAPARPAEDPVVA